MIRDGASRQLLDDGTHTASAPAGSTSGTPYVSRGRLRIRAAQPGVIAHLAELNPDASMETQ